MSQMGHSRRFWHVRAESASPRIATGQRTCWAVRVVPKAGRFLLLDEPTSKRVDGHSR